MGLYDTIELECPTCGTLNGFQSKSGPCELLLYMKNNVPVDVIQDVNRHAPIICYKCDTPYEAKVNYIINVETVRSKISDSDPD